MFYQWLDRWDEKRALRGDKIKVAREFAVGAEKVMPGADENATVSQLGAFADTVVADAGFFTEHEADLTNFSIIDGWLRFPSGIATETAENNTVWAKITDSGSREKVLVVFHHWNAQARQRQLASFLSRRGITVVEIAMPYHFERSRPGSSYADYILGPDLGRTLQSIRQAVWDGRKLIGWLKQEGYGEISVLGMSLGSWVAGLVAAHDAAVSKAALFLTAGSLADMVWTGRATRSIREDLEPHISLTDLRRVWGPLNLENHAHQLARPGLDLLVVLAKRDTVVLPQLSESFNQVLDDAGARQSLLQLNCGHYSLALPPYILFAGISLKRFLER